MEYLNGQDCSLLLTATGEWASRGPHTGADAALFDPGGCGEGHCSW